MKKIIKHLGLILAVLFAVSGFSAEVYAKEPDDEEAIAEAEEYEDPQKLKRKGWLRLGTVLVAIISLIVFILTEDMTLPMKLVDEYTIWMIIFLAAALLLALISRKVTAEPEEETG